MSAIIPPEIANDETFKDIVARLERHLDLLDACMARAEARQDTPYSTDLKEIEENADVDYMFLEPRSQFDRAIIGVDPWQSRIIYDEWLCVKAVMADTGLDEEDAIEHCAANVFTITEQAGGPIFSTAVRH